MPMSLMCEDLAIAPRQQFLKPLRAFRCLFRGDDLDEAVRELREAISLRDVTIQRGRVVLRQHKRAQDVGVDAIRARCRRDDIYRRAEPQVSNVVE